MRKAMDASLAPEDVRLLHLCDEYQDIPQEPTPPPSEHAKIKHRGVFIERQLQGATCEYLYICHTGIAPFLPRLYATQQLAIEAVDAKLDGPHKVFVNADEHTVKGSTISYAEVCRLAGEGQEASVKYTGKRYSGVLAQGRSVEIEDGMRFRCITTGNA
jgi:hypothetical protein